MLSTKQEYFNTVISKAVGPLPWYQQQEILVELSPKVKELFWKDLKGENNNRSVALVHAEYPEAAYMLASYYSYVDIKKDKIIAWKTRKQQNVSAIKIEIKIFDLSKDVEPDICIGGVYREIQNSKEWIKSSFPLISEISIPAKLFNLKDKFDFPKEFKELDEVLVVANTAISEIDNPAYGIFSIRPQESVVRVSLQEWYNIGGYDFGYQWITRLIRDGLSQNILGEGIRLGQFILNPAGDKFLEWVNKY